MDNLLDFQHIEVIVSHGVVNFCLQEDLHNITQLPAKSNFAIVYSPIGNHTWEVVNYCVIQPKKAYAVINRRGLSPVEQQYFETLLKSTLSKAPYSNSRPPNPVSVDWHQTSQ